PAVFTVEVRALGSEPFTVECSPASPCGATVFAYGIVADSVEVIIVEGGIATTRDFFPEYHESRPNGPGCEPTCLQATVRVNFPI
ncbi:MAG: hypothetical protein O2956_15275, partial [Gemmatimonadetes bacterium]|nr:hypothetical protein [Gemmatimonadota bacterium]